MLPKWDKNKYRRTLHGQKYGATPFTIWIQVFWVPLAQVSKINHLAMHPVFMITVELQISSSINISTKPMSFMAEQLL